MGLGAARLVSTPSVVSYGLARDYQLKGFPEFEQFYSGDFPPSTQFGLSPLRLPFRHARTPRGVIGRKFSLAKTDKAEIAEKYFGGYRHGKCPFRLGRCMITWGR